MHVVEPIKAAAGIILTEETPARVLLARRSRSLRFMGGFHVFPGGRIDDAEPLDTVFGAADRGEAAAIHAVAREIFEETGLLMVDGAAPPADVCEQARRSMNGSGAFDTFLVQHGLRIDARRFEPAGVWVTPAIAPVRFDTRYYICRTPSATRATPCGGEIDAVDWFTPADAREAWRDGRIQLPPPVAYVLQNLAAYPFPEVWDHLRSSGEHTGERPAKMEFANGIYILPLRSATILPATHTNCTIVGERDLYLIDPGADDEEELGLLRRQVGMLENLGGRVTAVLLTHSHVDHVAAANYCRQTWNIGVWAHPATAEQLAKSPKPVRVDRMLVDGETITVGGDRPWRLRCVHTPGHDPGHLCFIEETTGTLIAGDMLANPGTIVVSPDYAGDMAQFIASLERLTRETFDVAIPAHGMPVPNGPRQIQKHLEHRLWREEKVKEAVASGARTLEDILRLAYDDVEPEAWPLARHSLRAHLVKLGVNVAS